MPQGKRKSEFGKGVIESAQADDELRAEVGWTGLQTIISLLIGSGLLTCGFSEMFAK